MTKKKRIRKKGKGSEKSSDDRHATEPSAKKELFFKFAAIILPVFLIVFFELALRLLDYGGDTSLFIPTPNETSPYYGINRDVGKRYFSNIDFVPAPRKDLFLRNKPANGYRIFVLGGSTTAGFPYGNNLMFTRILHRRLLDTFPDLHIEVVNTAMSAVNSYTALDFMEEILPQQPDAILIYMGHNEYYGALGVGSVESLGKQRVIVKTYLKLQSFRVFVLVQKLVRWLQSTVSNSKPQNPGADPTATAMARIVREQKIPFGSVLYEAGKEQFRENLREILQIADDAAIPVLISELVSNIRDQSPFESVKTDSLPSASDIFKKARSLELSGKYGKAREMYYRAKDLDALRFRAPEEFNEVIHQVASEFDVPVIPMKSYFEEESPNGLIGNKLMLEHLHPNLDGYFLLADAFYEGLRKHRFIGDFWKSGNEKNAEYYRRNWGYTALDSVYAALSIAQLKGGWPFKKQAGPNFALQQYSATTNEESIVLEILRSGTLTLETGHLKLAEMYEKTGDLKKAFYEYRALTNIVPYLDVFYEPAIKTLMELRDYGQAKTLLEGALRYQESYFVYKWLGQIDLILGNTEKGIAHLRDAQRLSPADAQLLFNLGMAYFNNSQFDKGRTVLAQLLRRWPNSAEAAKLSEHEKLLQKKRENALAYIQEARSYLKERQLDKAMEVLQASLRLQQTPTANELIGEILLLKGQQSKAVGYLERAKGMKTAADPKLLYNLSSAYYLNGQGQKALDTFRDLKKVYPDFNDPGNLETKIRNAIQKDSVN